MDGFFIDKLCVTQDHAPIVEHRTIINSDGKETVETFIIPSISKVGAYRNWRTDLQTGQTTESIGELKYEGSYSSSLQIRSDGFRVSVYGNPSRWGRIDNLYGLKTIDECISVYNHILEGLGLPLFTKCTKYYYYIGKEGTKAYKTADGAIIKHIDFTRNLAVGKGNERAYNKALSTQSIGRSVPPFLYPDENTVEWYGANIQKNGSTYRYIKVYTKTADLLRNQKKLCKGVEQDDRDYFDDLLQFTVKNGVIREEHSFKREYLKKHDLFAYGLFDETAFIGELQVITDIRKRLEVNNMKYETIAQQLLDEKICTNRQSANSTQMYYSMWLHGEYMDKTKSQFREHKRRLLQIGIDISVKLDITRAPLRLKSTEVIEVKTIEAPSWYRQPTVPKPTHNLRLVA